MRGKQGWGPGKGRGPCIIRHNLPVITIFALRTTVYHLPVCQTARMFCSIMWRVRGVSLGVYNNNPSPELRPLSSTRSSSQYRVRKSFYHRFIINNITISIYLSTGQNFTHGYFDNKLLENDSYCRQDKLWSNRRERAGGQSLGHPLDVCPVLVWGYKGKETWMQEDPICVFLILVSLKQIGINSNFLSKVMTLKIYFLPV